MTAARREPGDLRRLLNARAGAGGGWQHARAAAAGAAFDRLPTLEPLMPASTARELWPAIVMTAADTLVTLQLLVRKHFQMPVCLDWTGTRTWSHATANLSSGRPHSTLEGLVADIDTQISLWKREGLTITGGERPTVAAICAYLTAVAGAQHGR